jgi:hypothetical protein
MALILLGPCQRCQGACPQPRRISRPRWLRDRFELDLSFRPEGSAAQAAGALEVWAATAPCGADQLLFTSPQAARDWQTHCVTFVAERNYRYLKLRAAPGSSATTGVFVDNIVPVASSNP